MPEHDWWRQHDRIAVGVSCEASTRRWHQGTICSDITLQTCTPVATALATQQHQAAVLVLHNGVQREILEKYACSVDEKHFRRVSFRNKCTAVFPATTITSEQLYG